MADRDKIWSPEQGVTRQADQRPLKITGAGGIKVSVSADGKSFQISLDKQPDPVLEEKTLPVAATANTKWFACRLTGEAEVTVGEGRFYSYDIFATFSADVNLRQLEWSVSEVAVPDLVHGDRICLIVNRTKTLQNATADVAGVGDDSASWLWAEFENGNGFYTVGKIAAATPEDQFPVTLGGPFYYQIATYFNDDAGERVEQKSDGFFSVPHITLPKAIA